MKKNLIVLMSLMFVISVYSQKIIKNPKTGFSTVPYLFINNIEMTDSMTVVSFQISQYSGYKFSIPKKTYIKDVLKDEKLFIKSAEGVSMKGVNVVPESGVLNYKLIFGKLDKSVTKIEYGEANDGGDWFIHDIALQDVPNPSGINKELEGNWFNTNNGNWEIGFFDNNVVYKNQVWNYEKVTLKNGNGSVRLSNKDKNVTLLVKKGKEGSYFIGENLKSLNAFSNSFTDELLKTIPKDVVYEMPVFKSDSATYSGYIKNYSPKAAVKTIAIHIDDIITGAQNTFVAQINNNGFFSIKLPLYYPHEVWVRSSIFNGSVYLEPGKDVFQLLGDRQTIFMGESARINADLLRTQNVRRSDYEDMMRIILDMNPQDYKIYCQGIANKKMESLESIRKSNAIGSKAYQIGKLEIEYNAIAQMMNYQRDKETAFRLKNKIPNNQMEISLKKDTLTADYYQFLTDDVINNPLAVISTHSYQNVINSLQFLDLLRLGNFSNSFLETADEIEKSGYSLTKEEQQLLIDFKDVEAFQNRPAQKEFEKKYGEISASFFTKHQKIIKEIRKDGIYNTSDLEAYLIKNNIPISKEEKDFIKAEKRLAKETSPEQIKKNFAVYEALNSFYQKHQILLSQIYNEKRAAFRNKKLAELFTIKEGFATDIMKSQDICNKVVDQLTPLSQEELIRQQQSIQTPFIADYIKKCNNESLAKIQVNKLKTGYVLNETPKTEADKLFAEIMNKYKDKLVYVDFWATWCGPCRSGIERIKPLKEEMKDKGIVFVYLTNQSSPEQTYSAMIPDIKGEHYRLSTDEWNYLAAKFNISGIPHYMLVSKDGQVINPKLGQHSNEELKKILEKEL
ncbi:TlpA family protein disulfide reductase [Flavobacterium flavipallidum]|uniref:TlpA disulfide reductase family protein n=1 Tax=Flavobacterium flavipallidum TaxID=3139140 RepID=A0ABU9HMD7_9FLAO